MLQILIMIILAWLVMNISIMILIRSAVNRADYWQSDRDRLSKNWAKNQKKFNE